MKPTKIMWAIKNMKKFITTLYITFLCLLGAAQKWDNVTISATVQPQYQWGEKDASLGVGTENENKNNSFSRIGIRRGYIRIAYEEQNTLGVFQVDVTERGVSFIDVFFKINDPWINKMAMQAGVFSRPFGFEVGYSSARRESPERSMIISTLFPESRDLGAMLVLNAPKNSLWDALTLESGLFAGNGIKMETDSKRDFIGHLSMSKTFEIPIVFGVGMSYYNGKVYQGTEKVYAMVGKQFVVDEREKNKGAFAKREYVGFDIQCSLLASGSQIRGEFIFGQQPGTLTSSRSPNSSILREHDTYIRNFKGGYLIYIQDIGKLPFSFVGKYDWYNPNIKVSANEIDSKTDLLQYTFGMGALWYINKNTRLQAFYEICKNEKSIHIENMKKNMLTLRLQYQF